MWAAASFLSDIHYTFKCCTQTHNRFPTNCRRPPIADLTRTHALVRLNHKVLKSLSPEAKIRLKNHCNAKCWGKESFSWKLNFKIIASTSIWFCLAHTKRDRRAPYHISVISINRFINNYFVDETGNFEHTWNEERVKERIKMLLIKCYVNDQKLKHT